MRGILLVAHGTRTQDKADTMEGIGRYVGEKFPKDRLKIAYLDFSQKSIKSQLNEMREEGIKEILVIPYFLGKGVHTKVTVPNQVEEYRETYPEIKISMGKHLGLDTRIGDVVVDRILEIYPKK